MVKGQKNKLKVEHDEGGRQKQTTVDGREGERREEKQEAREGAEEESRNQRG